MTSSFDQLAPWYDAIYAARGKDFAAEAAAVLACVRAARGGEPPRSLLDVACGTGLHLAALAGTVPDRAGLDAHAGMLGLARRRLPGVPLHEGDMRRFDLRRRFDAVTCLFASTGYLADAIALGEAVAAMARHLAPGGILVIEPPLFPAEAAPPRRQVTTVETAEGRVERVATARLDGGRLEIDFAFTISTPGGRRTAGERHAIRLFTLEEHLEALGAAGLAAELRRSAEPPTRLLVARRATDVST